MDIRSPALALFRGLYRTSPLKLGLTRIAAGLRPYVIPSGADAPPMSRRVRLDRGFLADLDLRDRIQYMMYVRGVHEPQTETALAQALPRGGCFVDVGANIGYFTLLVAADDPTAKIFAFEPWRENVARLKANVALNKFGNVIVTDKACADSPGAVQMTSADPTAESGWASLQSSTPDPLNERRSVQSVEATTLDIELDRLACPPIDVLKLDIEGSELKALRGARRRLASAGRRYVIVEINEACLASQGASRQQIDELLCDLGYRFEKLTDGMNAHYLKDN